MQDHTFTPESKLIWELFTGWYKIPVFQRPYRWSDEDISKLWNDLKEAFDSQKDDSLRIYFLGAIIVSPSKKTDDIYFDVIDGQQRLTSLMILFSVVRDHYPQINESSSNQSDIKLKDLHRAIDNENPDAGPRVVIDTRLVPDAGAITHFSNFVCKHGATRDNHPQPSKGELDNDNPKHNYIRAVKIFKESLKKLENESSIEGISNFINFVFNQVKVIQIRCASADFAMEMFEIINTRGMNLRPSDLIKIFLLIKIQENADDENARDRASDHFITEWRKIEKYAQDSNSTIDEMLILYSYYKLVESPGKDFYLYNKLKKHLSTANSRPNDIIADIKRFVGNYKKYLAENVSTNQAILSLSYLPWNNLWKSVVLSAMQNNYHNQQGYQTMLKQLLRFYYLHWIAGNNMGKVKKVSFEVIESIKNPESPIGDITTILSKHLQSNNVIEKALKYLNSSQAGQEPWCKPLLFSVNYTLTDGESLLIGNDAKSQLEHVLPEKFKGNPGWGHITDTVERTYLQSLGNLTLLSGSKNRDASNKSFAQKIKYYKGLLGNQGGTSSFEVTQKIIKMYDKGTTKKWGMSSIKARRTWILTETAKLLEIKKEMRLFLKKNKKPSLP